MYSEGHHCALIEQNYSYSKKSHSRIIVFHPGVFRFYRLHYTWRYLDLDPRTLIAALLLSIRAFINLVINDTKKSSAAHEDVELGCRLSKKRLRILFNKEALGYHCHVETLNGTLQRGYQKRLNWVEFREIVNHCPIPCALLSLFEGLYRCFSQI